MRAQQTIYTWDYHHGQATRVIIGGLAPLRGTTMGAVLTEPATADGDIGILFLSPQGYFDMCGDSTFSGVAALIESGIIPHENPDGVVLIKLDTVAGRVNVRVQLKAGEPLAITFDNVPSFSLGSQLIQVQGIGSIEACLGFGGLSYAFVQAHAVGIDSLRDLERDRLLEIGTRVWQAAREQTSIRFPNPSVAKPVDLITLWEPLGGERGARVANFYAPLTTGRTPSGTGLAARVAIEAAAGRLAKGETFCHESLLGLRFTARIVEDGVARSNGGAPGIIPSVTARSFLMGTCQWILHPDDPFRSGFTF